MQYLNKYSETTFTLLRIVAGMLFACHGAQKLFGVLGHKAVSLMSQPGAAGIIEFFGGVLILLGLFTSWAALITSGEMAVAYFMVHFPRGFWPIENRGEPAVVYAFLFLFIACHGSGCWSLDRLLRKK